MRPDAKIEGLTWYIDGGHTLESIEVAGRWFADTFSTLTQSTSDITTTRVLIFNQQTRDASNLAKRLHSTLASALADSHPFKHAVFCPNITYEDTGYKADLVSINTNKHDIDSLKVQRELASTWDQIDPDSEVHVVGTIEEAVKRARQLAERTDGIVDVMVTGSLHLVGGLIEVLESEVEKARL
jgi:folylpolyglutamate synthase